jgi:2-amino-4-hydroxy-6-hydroxymethyldihydropteridine diphosphokinase
VTDRLADPVTGAVPVWLGLGTNLGDREENLRRALDHLAPLCGPLAVSAVYETPPWGVTDQPAFLNLVARGRTALPPCALLRRLKEFDVAVGRTPSRRWGPRVIDVDILAYDALVLDTEALTVPHARLHERAFVLVPLAELDPGWMHPRLRRTARELLAALPDDDVRAVRRLGPLRAPDSYEAGTGSEDGGEGMNP